MSQGPSRAKILAPPVVLAALCVGLAVPIDRYVPTPIFDPASMTRVWLSLAVLLAAGVLMLWSLRAFHLKRTTVNPYGAPQSLVVVGPYHFSRNPQYVALVALVVGAALVANSYWVVASALVLAGLLHFGVIKPEERLLAELFGNGYSDYAHRVRRWL